MTVNRDHEAAIAIARAKLAQRPVYLDTETTGFGSSAEIVDICILDTDGSVLIDTLVRPVESIPADATKVHGISTEMVASAPAWPDVWPQVKAALDGRVTAIYNADFDLRMLRQSLSRNGMLQWPPQYFCAMELYAQFYGEPGRNDSYRWQSLANAGRQCGLLLPNAHRARADALLMRLVLEFMANGVATLL